MQRQLLWLWATPAQGVFRGQRWLDRRFVLLQMIPHLHETMELTVVFLIMRAQPIPSAAGHMHPWVRVQWVCLMACSSCTCRQQKKLEISDRSMEQFCHVTFSLSSSPAATQHQSICRTLQIVSKKGWTGGSNISFGRPAICEEDIMFPYSWIQAFFSYHTENFR